MLGLWLIIVGGVETVLSALAVIFRRFERPFAWISLFVGLFAIVGGSVLYWHDAHLWQLTDSERAGLRREACAQETRYQIPIFWAKADSDSQSYAEDILGVFGFCDWPVWMEPKAWVGPKVVGINVDAVSKARQTAKSVAELKRLFKRAGIEVGDSTEMQGNLMPDGVGIKIGSRPKL